MLTEALYIDTTHLVLFDLIALCLRKLRCLWESRGRTTSWLGLCHLIKRWLQMIVRCVEWHLLLICVWLALNQKIRNLVIIEFEKGDVKINWRIPLLLSIEIINYSWDQPKILAFHNLHQTFILRVKTDRGSLLSSFNCGGGVFTLLSVVWLIHKRTNFERLIFGRNFFL